jgi:hypothetical protein
MSSLTPEKGLIFRITHIENVPWILENGLYCRNSKVYDPNYVEIGNPELIVKRTHRTIPIPPGGSLSEYIPFYFTPYSPMLLNIKTGYNGLKQVPMSQIVILVADLPGIRHKGINFVFSDRHAYLQAARFFSDLKDLINIDWKSLQARDFKRNPDDPGKFERHQAEALIHNHMPTTGLSGIVCYNSTRQATVQQWANEVQSPLRILSKPDWYV